MKYCIVGAGPSGLAMAREFSQLGIAYDHFERHSDVGGIWELNSPGSPMYESAHFISSKTMSGFPGYPMPEHYPDYPKHGQILEYLKSFCEAFELKTSIQFNTLVEGVVPESGQVRVSVMGEQRVYRGVVCASGLNWSPTTPSYPGSFSGEMRHVVTYRAGKELEGKRVLVIGLGNSGADIACDAARFAKSVSVSVRRGYHFLPKHIFGKPADVFASEGPHLPVWLEQPIFGLLQRALIGDTAALGMPKPDHKVLQSHPLMNDQLLHHLRHGDAELRPEVERLHGQTVHFKDGSQQDYDLILLATGYDRGIPYLDPVHLDEGASWAGGQFLTAFSRRYDSLFTLGYIELNGALYPHLGRLARLIAKVAELQLTQPERANEYRTWMQTTRFDLTGGRHHIPTARHAHYCDLHALTRCTDKAFKRMGWKAPSP